MANTPVPTSAPKPLAAAVGDTLAITAFTAAHSTVASVDPADAAKIVLGNTWTLVAEFGDTDAKAVIDGATVTVSAINGSDATLDGVDLSASDVQNLTATATVASVAPAPSPSPTPPPAPPTGLAAMEILMRYPSPGVAVMPVDVNPEDTLPGTRFADDAVPDPENPTGPALSPDKVQALKDAMKANQVVMPVLS